MNEEIVILKVGDRVKAIDKDSRTIYKGTCVEVNSYSNKASIQRDDKRTGGGMTVPGYGATWSIVRMRNGCWNPEDEPAIKLVAEYVDDWEHELA